MPKIVAKGDNLNELNANFVQQRLLEPVFLNSVPKCGTHLVRNVMRMFVPVEQQYHQAFIQHAILREHQVAFSEAMPHLSWGIGRNQAYKAVRKGEIPSIRVGGRILVPQRAFDALLSGRDGAG